MGPWLQQSFTHSPCGHGGGDHGDGDDGDSDYHDDDFHCGCNSSSYNRAIMKQKRLQITYFLANI